MCGSGPERSLDFTRQRTNPPVSDAEDRYPCADQGCAIVCGRWCSVGSTGGMRGSKRSLYEGGIRSLLILRWAAHVAPGTIDRTTVASAADLLPTLLSAAGVTLPAGQQCDGENLLARLLGPQAAGPQATTRPPARRVPIFFEWDYGDPSDEEWWPKLAVRSGPWKLLYSPPVSYRGKVSPMRTELYNVEVCVRRSLSDLTVAARML